MSSTWRQFLQRCVSQPGVTRFFAGFIASIDRPILQISNGRFSPTGYLAGWPIVYLETIGAKSGQKRHTPLIGILDGQKIVLIASNFGKSKNPGWYHNLKAYPQARITFRGSTGSYIAHEATRVELEQYWELSLTTFTGYQLYQERAQRQIPIMVLEPM